MLARKKAKTDWKNFDGAAKTKRRLRLEKSADGKFHCPVEFCDHDGFLSKRGCRKHVKSRHGWFYYFDTKPDMSNSVEKHVPDVKSEKQVSASYDIPSLPKDSDFAKSFVSWLTSTTGGGRTKGHADQVLSRVLKCLRSFNEDFVYDEVNNVDIDFCLGSTETVSKFIDTLQTEWNIGGSGQIGYIFSLLDLMDFRKFQGVSGNILQNFTVVEMFLKRARKCISKQMRIISREELDIETLESKGHWATMKELQQVIPFHLPRYNSIVQLCKNKSLELVSSSDLTFATRFITTFLFLRVKGTRPMTYQYLTVNMFTEAEKNGGYVDQKMFKTADQYVFDSILLDDICIKIIGTYVTFIRPLLSPSCGYLLINRNGKQLCKLTDCFSILVFEAIGKYVNPTRYRQIIETESCNTLSLEECGWITEDQKHSSEVAKCTIERNARVILL